jgi:hypothetical protein
VDLVPIMHAVFQKICCKFLRFAKIITAIPFFCIAACSSVSPSTSPVDKVLNIKLSEPYKIHFQGKVVGAGIALMSSMGPIGMAIGVAIDEGISKQITQTQLASNKHIKNLILQQAGNTLSGNYDVQWNTYSQIDSKSLHSNYIIIEKIGFRLQPGHADGVCGEVIISIISQNHTPTTFYYPNDINVSEDQKNTACVVYELEKLKTDEIYLNQALSDVLGRTFLMSSKHITPESFKNNKG